MSRQKNIASLVKLYYLMLTWDTTAQGTAIGGGGGAWACGRSWSSVLHDKALHIRAGKAVNDGYTVELQILLWTANRLRSYPHMAYINSI